MATPFPSIPDPLIAIPQLYVVPIFWGQSWIGHTPYNCFDVLENVTTIMSGRYLDGLAEYGIAAGGAASFGAVLHVPDSEIPNPFHDEDCWGVIDRAISAKSVEAPAVYDQPALVGARYRTIYSLFVAPSHYYTDPNIFGKNWTDYRPGAAATWVSSNSDLAGAIETFAHELIEGGSGAQIADDCETERFELDGIRLPKYKVDGNCWPDLQTQLVWMEEKLARYRQRERGFVGRQPVGIAPTH